MRHRISEACIALEGGMMAAENKEITVFLAEDSTFMRVGLTHILDNCEGLRVVGCAQSGPAAVEGILATRPDIVLMDISLPVFDGIEATARVKAEFPETQIIMLTEHKDRQRIFSSLKAGASGYCLKSTAGRQLTLAVKTVALGAVWLDSAVASDVLQTLAAGGQEQAAQPALPFPGKAELSNREKEVLRLLTDGCSNPEIADKLVLSIETVKTHIRHIFEKLEVEDRTHAAVLAVRHNLVSCA